VHAGDALAVRAVAPLLDQPRLSAHLVQRVTREFLDAAGRTLEGQSMELAWRDDASRAVSLDDYLRLVLHKSCWYTTIYPLRAGCLIGSRGAVPLGPLTAFGFLLGAAFQVRDDVLDLAGDPEVHGKESLADSGRANAPLFSFTSSARPTATSAAGSSRSSPYRRGNGHRPTSTRS
jgi:geranylgeranyl diphosphate synthase, type II